VAEDVTCILFIPTTTTKHNLFTDVLWRIFVMTHKGRNLLFVVILKVKTKKSGHTAVHKAHLIHVAESLTRARRGSSGVREKKNLRVVIIFFRRMQLLLFLLSLSHFLVCVRVLTL